MLAFKIETLTFHLKSAILQREEVFSRAALLKGSGLLIAEDISRQTRDKRTELRNFLRDLKVKQPGLRYHLAFDKLYVGDSCFQWSEAERKVVLVQQTRPVSS